MKHVYIPTWQFDMLRMHVDDARKAETLEAKVEELTAALRFLLDEVIEADEALHP